MTTDQSLPPVQGLGDLADVLTTQPPTAGGAVSLPLDVALREVGKAMGVDFPSVAGLEPKNGSWIKASADIVGVRIHSVTLPADWSATSTYPFIGYRGEGFEPVAILPRGARSWDWVDGATGARHRVDSAFVASLHPAAMAFVRPLPEGPVSARSLISYLLTVLKKPLISVMIIGIFSAIMGIVMPIASKMVFGQILPSGQKSLLWAVVGLLGGAGAVTISLAYAGKMAELRVSGVMLSTLVPATWDRLLRLPASFFRLYSVGDLQARMTGLEDLRTGLQACLRLALAFVSGLVAIVMMLIYSPELTAIAVAGLLLSWLIVIPLLVMRIRRTTTLMTIHGQVVALEFELFQAVAKLRVAAAEARAFDAWAAVTARQLRVGWVLIRLTVIGICAAALVPALIAAVLYAVTGTALIQTLSVGDFMGFTTAAGMLAGSFGVIRKSLDEGLLVVPMYRRLLPIFAAAPEDPPNATSITLQGEIDLDQVVFRYEADGPAVLDGVSIHAAPGEFIAITGTSGAGKSTIIRLLLGFEQAESGSVLFDGSDLAQLSKPSVRAQIGTVNQRAKAAAGTIASSILGGSQLPIERAWAAAEMAGIADDIRALPMQMQTVIGEGSPVFSGGQIQRIVIARAVVTNPRVLLLDEATSALDNTVQAAVGEALAGLSATRVVVAHRLSTIRDADRIYVLDAGKVVQSGSYAELMAVDGQFRTLAERQLVDPIVQV